MLGRSAEESKTLAVVATKMNLEWLLVESTDCWLMLDADRLIVHWEAYLPLRFGILCSSRRQAVSQLGYPRFPVWLSFWQLRVRLRNPPAAWHVYPEPEKNRLNPCHTLQVVQAVTFHCKQRERPSLLRGGFARDRNRRSQLSNLTLTRSHLHLLRQHCPWPLRGPASF